MTKTWMRGSGGFDAVHGIDYIELLDEDVEFANGIVLLTMIGQGGKVDLQQAEIEQRHQACRLVHQGVGARANDAEDFLLTVVRLHRPAILQTRLQACVRSGLPCLGQATGR